MCFWERVYPLFSTILFLLFLLFNYVLGLNMFITVMITGGIYWLYYVTVIEAR